MGKPTHIGREKFFQMVSNKDWDSLFNLFRDNDVLKIIINDEIMKQFAESQLINELIRDSINIQNDILKEYLKRLLILDSDKKYKFKLNNIDHKKIVIKLVTIEENIDYAYYYAKKYPDEDICKNIINKFTESRPNIFHHSQESIIKVTQNKNIKIVDASISLFKSPQEYDFFNALRKVFQMWMVLPNVALSAVIDFNLIKDELSKPESDYFFRALIDCVVIDTENEYKPYIFIELDSSYHDSNKQKQKDLLKDSILAKAGQKLFRIRQKTFKEREKGFIKLIRESFRDIEKR